MTAPAPRRSAATGQIALSVDFHRWIRRAFDLCSSTPDCELSCLLARAFGIQGYRSPDVVDVPLLRRVLRCPDDNEANIALLLADVASEATAAENRALLCEDNKQAAVHWATADSIRRRAGVPEKFLNPDHRRKSL